MEPKKVVAKILNGVRAGEIFSFITRHDVEVGEIDRVYEVTYEIINVIRLK